LLLFIKIKGIFIFVKKSPLINKNFALLFFGRLVSDIGNFLYQFAIGWYILTITSSAAQAGLYMAFGGIVFLVLTPIAGILVDRLDRLKIIIYTDFIRGATVLIAGLFIVLKPQFMLGSLVIDFSSEQVQLFTLYITSFIFSVNGALFAPAVTTLVPYIVEDKDLQKANSLHSGQHALVSIVGALFAGILYGLLGIGFIFLINGFAYILSAISETFIKALSKEVNKTKLTLVSAYSEFKEGLDFIIQQPGMFMFVLVVLIVNFFASPIFSVAQPYFYNQIVNAEPYLYSFVGLGFSVGSIIMAIRLSTKESKDKVYPSLIRGLLGVTLGISLFGLLVLGYTQLWINFSVMFALSLVVSLFVGLMITYVNTPIGVAIHRYVPKEKMGRVNSMISLMAQGVVPLSTALTGFVIENSSLVLFYAFAATGMALGAFVAIRSRSIKAF
jgi:MFS transporter, DHA3 family, macrolide efflux protein